MRFDSSLLVDLAIPREEFLKLYSGAAHTVSARARDGRQVRFPAKILVPFVDHDGVYGHFRITFNRNCKFESIARIGTH